MLAACISAQNPTPTATTTTAPTAMPTTDQLDLKDQKDSYLNDVLKGMGTVKASHFGSEEGKGAEPASAASVAALDWMS